MRKNRFNLNDRVSFMARTVELEDSLQLGVLKSLVGYVKQVRRRWWGKTRYAICVAKTNDVYIVDEQDVLGIAEKKDYKQPKTEE